MTIQPRLLPDFAAVPTPRERANVRRHWANAQCDLFGIAEPDAEPACPVCAGPHAEPDCKHGSAPTLDYGTSAQRDENRLTESDRARIAERVTEYATRSRKVTSAERFTTAERLAHAAIGCAAHDLRCSELDEIADTVRRIIEHHTTTKTGESTP